MKNNKKIKLKFTWINAILYYLSYTQAHSAAKLSNKIKLFKKIYFYFLILLIKVDV